MYTYIIDDATTNKQNPRKNLRHVSCFLSNGCDLPPQLPAHRQQQKHNPISGIRNAVTIQTNTTRRTAQYFLTKSPYS